MRRYQVLFRPEAQKDLVDIFERILVISQDQQSARRFVSRIVSRCRRIGNVPRGGRPRDDLSAGMRIVPFEHSAVVAYIVTDKVEILNIFYGGRDYEALYVSQGTGD